MNRARLGSLVSASCSRARASRAELTRAAAPISRMTMMASAKAPRICQAARPVAWTGASRAVRQRVGELADEIEETQSRHRSLDAQVDGIDDPVAALERTQQELEETQEGLHESMDSTAAAVRSLAATVGRIQRRLHTERDIPAADVDTADDVLRQLATRARQGQQSAAVLLDEPARTMHQGEYRRVDEHGDVAAGLSGHLRSSTQWSRSASPPMTIPGARSGTGTSSAG